MLEMLLLAAASAVAGSTAVLARTPPPPLVVPAVIPSVTFHRPLTAASFVAIDLHDGRVLLASKPNRRRPIASLTKVMTATLAIEAGDPEHRVRVPRAATRVEPNKDDLVAGRYYTRTQLLYSALVISANDSAYALATDIGGTLDTFYTEMNAAAQELGMRHTRYGSPNGLDDVNNWSTALDQARLARYALGDPTFARIVATRTRMVPWAPPVNMKEYVNHNKMLFSFAGTYGVKTGYTMAAGSCLIAAVRRDGHDVLAVVLGSADVWQDMPRVITAALARAS